MGGFLGPQRAFYLLLKASSLLRLSGRTRSQRAKLVPAYMLFICLLLVLACSRIPNPFSSVSALPIARAARLAPTPTPHRYLQSQPMTGASQSSGQAFDDGVTRLEENPILGPVNPAMTLAALLELTQTGIAAETSENVLGGLATPLATLKTPTPTPTSPFRPPTETGPETSATPAQAGAPSMTPIVSATGTPEQTATKAAIAGPTKVPMSPTPTATPTTEPTPTETPKPGGLGGGGAGGLPGPVGGATTPTATPFSTPAPTSTVDPTGLVPTATSTRTPRSTRTPNPAYPTLTPIPEGAFLDIVDIRLSPGSYTGVHPGSTLTFEIWVEPNGQEVSVVQVVLVFDPDVLQAKSSDVDPDAPLSVRLVPDDSFDNDTGVIVISITQDKNAAASPSTNFLMGTITMKVDSSVIGSTSTSVDFVRFGDVRTVVGIEGAEVTDDLFGATVMIEPPATPTPVS